MFIIGWISEQRVCCTTNSIIQRNAFVKLECMWQQCLIKALYIPKGANWLLLLFSLKKKYDLVVMRAPVINIWTVFGLEDAVYETATCSFHKTLCCSFIDVLMCCIYHLCWFGIQENEGLASPRVFKSNMS